MLGIPLAVPSKGDLPPVHRKSPEQLVAQIDVEVVHDREGGRDVVRAIAFEIHLRPVLRRRLGAQDRHRDQEDGEHRNPVVRPARARGHPAAFPVCA